jgi:type I restriction enzyme S subunit
MLFPGDIYASLKGATKDNKMIGSIARVPSSVPTGRLTQDTVKLVFRGQCSKYASYLHWVLRTPQYREYCAGHAMGSAVVALSRRDFLSYPVPQPTIERVTIAAVLDAIEARIELNRRLNQTFEAMARALFKSWFVDFDPVRAKAQGGDAGLPKRIADLFPSILEDSEFGEIPKGWTIATLQEVLDVLETGGRPKGGVSEYTKGVPSIGAESVETRYLTGAYVVDEAAKKRLQSLGLALPATINPMLFFR